MATQIGSLFGDVSLRTANMDKSIKGIQKKLGAMGKDFTQFGKKLSLGLTAPIVGFGAASFAAFNKQAKAEAGLRSALESSGQAVESNMTKIKALASQIQKVTTVGDESSIALAQIGTSMGLSVEQMEPALKGAIGLSESFGLGIDTSMRIATTAVQGNTEMLERYMKDLKDIEDPSAKAEEVTKRLAAGFDLAKAKAKEGTGPLTQLGNAIGDLMEPIGKVIMEAMQPWIDKMKKIVAYFYFVKINRLTTAGKFAKFYSKIRIGETNFLP